jgi:hypothetical protein
MLQADTFSRNILMSQKRVFFCVYAEAPALAVVLGYGTGGFILAPKLDVAKTRFVYRSSEVLVQLPLFGFIG